MCGSGFCRRLHLLGGILVEEKAINNDSICDVKCIFKYDKSEILQQGSLSCKAMARHLDCTRPSSGVHVPRAAAPCLAKNADLLSNHSDELNTHFALCPYKTDLMLCLLLPNSQWLAI